MEATPFMMPAMRRLVLGLPVGVRWNLTHDSPALGRDGVPGASRSVPPIKASAQTCWLRMLLRKNHSTG